MSHGDPISDIPHDRPKSARVGSSTIVVCHGAWSGGWVWRAVRAMLRERGHEVFTPTYTGLGERGHQASAAIDLDMHINDIIGVLEAEDLRDVVLVAHSYGGMVATGVADRCRPRIKQLIFVNGFVPKSGQAVSDLTSHSRWWRNALLSNSEVLPDWLILPPPLDQMTSLETLAWVQTRRRPQPKRTFTQPLTLCDEPLTLPRGYIYSTQTKVDDVFAQYQALRVDPDWQFIELQTGHNAHIHAPGSLVQAIEALLLQ